MTSPITVSGVTGNAPSDLQVSVDIKHTYRGDLQIDLIAPDGTAYRLKSTSTSDSADNVIATYTVNASSEVGNGTWRLQVARPLQRRHRLHRLLASRPSDPRHETERNRYDALGDDG